MKRQHRAARAAGRRGRVLGGSLAALVLLALGSPDAGRAETELHGFVEAGYGVRTATNPWFEEPTHPRYGERQDYTLNEVRTQLRLNQFGEVGEVFARLDVLHDQITEETDLILREGYFRFSTLANRLEVKAGRQALNWGTGDLVFVNDLFPKDWVSFFAGREDQYLKAPSDALRLGIFGLPVNVDLVLTPEFTPDNLPSGERFSFHAPPVVNQPPREPRDLLENGEVALRLSRYVGNFDLNGYVYRGFYKTPLGLDVRPLAADPTMLIGTPLYPELNVYGASARGGFANGVAWLEGGYYDTREDRDGDDPMLPNSSLRYLVGYERQLFTDFTAGIQYYGEWMMDHETYLEGLDQDGDGTVDPAFHATDELRQMVTLRLEKYMLYQTLRLSLFTFYSPSDEDVYARGLVSYKVSDEVEVATGVNVFAGEDARTMFGQNDKNDNAYVRLRYSF